MKRHHFFGSPGRREHYMDVELAGPIERQRNGVTGVGFWTVPIISTTTYKGERGTPLYLIGIVFDEDVDRQAVGVISPWDLGQHWRGDNFETILNEFINEQFGEEE